MKLKQLLDSEFLLKNARGSAIQGGRMMSHRHQDARHVTRVRSVTNVTTQFRANAEARSRRVVSCVATRTRALS